MLALAILNVGTPSSLAGRSYAIPFAISHKIDAS